ncbi:PPK2 family polyphosphate:nucleotide phosphotransferase [Algoriphagus ratkowskyi]|uniref:PPK2 family polyphosphate:nucleotide phosphotransferase n=1 Tax=Algoriphagus ratkowskyi TaxID=57028 RepID=A0A2W7R3L9_9BACT|nr:PPK2 family polyphosphate kinase [Algoriphagus ratkowskyi]PZX53816.1 PPK2 family polyphosphate:nucleotide phosphotransferase [Algoriphagus ratkowskyi]TXD76779.1 polyphosphate kinase 2 family protein [Algoriphagus ratkowskyi]
MKNISIDNLRVGRTISLKEIPTAIDLESSEKKKEKELNKLREKLSEHQDIMYAHNKYAVLICLQGMDTAGKDSLIREVFKEFNPRGVVVHSFKTPSTLELQHDYLWRHVVALPQRGKYGVFNRTHYENVLVTRVHPEYILGENIPGINSTDDITDEFWEKRFEQINNFEKQISDNGTIILKFYLHLGKEEQRQRLLRRLNKAKHNWKFSPGDLKERERWDDYQKCYEEAINKTSKPHAPWFIIPSDNKETARVLVAKAILEQMEKLTDIQEPELDAKVYQNIEMYKEILSKEK